MHMSGRKMAKSKIIGMPMVTKRMKCTVIVEDHVWFEDRWMVASLCDE
jgi:hypothetical protein